ncbi:MAG: PqiC family protein [Pseudomonadota bacterium]
MRTVPARKWSTTIATMVAAASMLAGCAGGGGNPPIRYYVIDPVPAAAPAEARDLTVEILGLTLPQYLERFQIATRSGADRLSFSDSHQWSENLRKNLLRTLARNLGDRLGTVDIGTPQNRTAATPDLRLTVVVNAFERQTDGRVLLDARWQVMAGGTGAEVTTHAATLRSDAGIDAGNHDRIVAEMRALFGQLSDRISATLLEVGA